MKVCSSFLKGQGGLGVEDALFIVGLSASWRGVDEADMAMYVVVRDGDGRRDGDKESVYGLRRGCSDEAQSVKRIAGLSRRRQTRNDCP